MNLTDFLDRLYCARTHDNENQIISEELAMIRRDIKSNFPDPTKQKINILKLIFLSNYCFDTTWGGLEALKLMSNNSFSVKRVGYLGMSLLVDQNNELLILSASTILKDLQSSNKLLQTLALTFVANFGTLGIFDTVFYEVKRLLNSKDHSVKKSAGMAALRIIKKAPQYIESFRNGFFQLFTSQSHSTVMAGLLIASEMLKIDPDYIKSSNSFRVQLTNLLKALFEARPTQEFHFGQFNDPFLIIKILKLLRELNQKSDESLDDLFTKIITSIDPLKKSGSSILYEAFLTIRKISNRKSLHLLVINQIGRLFDIIKAYSNRQLNQIDSSNQNNIHFKLSCDNINDVNHQNNIVYLILISFSKVLYHGKEIIGRSSKESSILQRFTHSIIDCLNSKDETIRIRALDVLCAFIDKSNIENLVKIIMSNIRNIDSEFRSEIIYKLFQSIMKFSPSPLWCLETSHILFIDYGDFVENEIIVSFCLLIQNNIEIRKHAINLLINTFYGCTNNETLVKLSSWVMGEYIPDDYKWTDFDFNDLISKMMETGLSDEIGVESKCYIMMAILKISIYFNKMIEMNKIKNFFHVLLSNSHTEIQQRAGEFVKILEKPEIWEDVIINKERNVNIIPVNLLDDNEDTDRLLIDIANEHSNT
ncbi:Adaptin N terminal region family protein [Tritrichomonas foetus]|uniref:Adaptin N terminal region family protein n=1 Tax=Tritrichomonas foetus TaxID=1144522 RepID=A0A1J4JQP8_9EUKA|nr:Adaptin N terminal region family protein [Tritrichomonas foetus]|eukprot:OHS99845.1 Adaptin N terminal region family protein [Tritrichomonas foetus]